MRVDTGIDPYSILNGYLTIAFPTAGMFMPGLFCILHSSHTKDRLLWNSVN